MIQDLPASDLKKADQSLEPKERSTMKAIIGNGNEKYQRE